MGCVPSKKRDELSASKKRVELSATTEWAILVRDTKARAWANGDSELALALAKHAKDLDPILDEEQRTGPRQRRQDRANVVKSIDKLQDHELHMLRLNLESKNT